MFEWLSQSFQENTILWLLISSLVGGIVGASARLVSEVVLPQQLQQRREVIAVKRKYATPILLSAEDLRRRLENIINNIETIETQNWLAVRDPIGYFFLSTLYVIGQFFGWVQILRRTVVYLDFTTTKETRRFERFLEAIEDGFSDPGLFGAASTPYPARTPDQWVFTFQLQAIGTSMIIREDNDYRTMDYADFEQAFFKENNEEIRRRFTPLSNMLKDLRVEDARFRRLVATHAILNAFIGVLDPNQLRTEMLPYHWDRLSDSEADRIKGQIARMTSQ